MRKYIWIILLTIALVIGGTWIYNGRNTERDQPGEERDPQQVGNGEQEQTDESSKDERLSLSNYFLKEQGIRLNFTGEGYAHTDRVTWVAHKKDNIVQHMEESAATTIAKVYDVNDTEIALIFAQEESYKNENYIDNMERNRKKVILRTPIEVGNTWQDDEMTYEIEAIDESLTVPYGTFETIKVREKNINGESESVNYYTEKYGLIKSIFTGNDYEITIELESIEK